MLVDEKSIEKAKSARRCDIDNIREVTRTYTRLNQELQLFVDKLIAGKQRLSEKEKQRLQYLLKVQSMMVLKPLDPGVPVAERLQYDNQNHRVNSIRQALKEVERRYGMRILPLY